MILISIFIMTHNADIMYTNDKVDTYQQNVDIYDT